MESSRVIPHSRSFKHLIIILSVLLIFTINLPTFSFHCDSGSLETTCIISTTQVLDSNTSIFGEGNLVIEQAADINTNGSDLAIAMQGFIENRGDINGAKSSWWNLNWPYRKPVSINNTDNPNDLTNFQVLVRVPYNSHMNADFSDLRFVDPDTNTELSYWIESYAASSDANVWVKVPSIPAHSTKTIYMYYGNSHATSDSNGDAVFEFFDDFESYPADSDIDGQGGWVTKRIGGAGEAKVRVMNGRKHLRLSSTDNATAVVRNIGTKNVTSSLGYALEMYDVATDWDEWNGEGFSVDGEVKTGGTGQDGVLYNGYAIGWVGWAGAYSKLRKVVNGVQTDMASISDSATNDVYYKHSLVWIGNSLKAYRNGLLKTETTDSSFSSFSYVYFGDWSGATWNHDWVLIRKYTSPEPTTALFPEETLSTQGSATVRFKTGTAEPFTDVGLIAYWNFDEGTGTTAGDSAGNNDGTIYGLSLIHI